MEGFPLFVGGEARAAGERRHIPAPLLPWFDAMIGEESAPEPFAWPVRVYCEDTDAGGVVYYANYLKFTERARTEWLRALGFDQTDLAQRERIAFVVRSAAIEFLSPARFNDGLLVTVELIKVGAGQIELVQRVLRGDELLATATVRVVCVRLPTMRPVRLPEPLATKIRTGN